MDNLTERLDALRQKLQESDFLQRKGLSNEVGIWIFQYNAADEMAVRHFTRQIAADQELHCRIIERNLYEIFLAILDDKHISAAIPRQEEKLGSKRLLEQLQKIATGDKFIDKIDYAQHQLGDVLLLTGVGAVFPLQQLALKSWLMSGDVFALIKRAQQATKLNPYTLRLHLVEADRVSTPDTCGDVMNRWANITEGKNTNNGNKIYDGVEVDGSGLAVAYWVRNTYPREISQEQTKWQRIEAVGRQTGLPNILHIMDSERPDQYRGVPYLAPVIEMLLQLRRYTESELMAALVQSFFTAWIVTNTDKTAIPTNEVGGGDIAGVPVENPDTDNISHSDNEYEMGPGQVYHLGPDEDIKFGSPNVPTAGFDTFVKTMCKMVGSGLEQPYEVLLKEFNSNYSASRGALLEAWEAYKMRRVWLVDGFCQPVYELWLAEAVARGRIKAPGFFDDPLLRAAWCGARWIGPVQGTLDPKKEVEAAILQVHHGFRTHEQVARELGGGDWEENVEQLKRENEMLKAAGVEKVEETTKSMIEGGDEDGEGQQNPGGGDE